jgi:predicted 3-demethylubiquinone-9 3-methyltransferase (glyoxalase superfamily)
MKVNPFLMFEGKAEEAMRFYVSLIPGSEMLEKVRYGPGQPGPEGSVKASVSLGGQIVHCTDSFVKHNFTFTPATSFFVQCEAEEELNHLTFALAEGGNVLMPVGNYGFSRLFAWVKDRFGVSWQLNFERNQFGCFGAAFLFTHNA